MNENFYAAARAGVRRLGWALAPALLVCGMAVAQPRVVYSPYQFLGLPGGPGRAAVVAPDGAAFPPGVALTWAFATGECGDEVWSGVPGQQVADANVAAFERAGLDFIISTGGQGGVFTCATDAGMARFLARYASPRFVGVDFDIEAEQTPAQIDSIVARARAAQRSAPSLRFSFTIATFAASDGSRNSLNATGEAVLAAARRHGLQDYVLNLMVMDYGPASAKVCVVRGGRCDMGASALQAARNVHEKYKVPYAQIELTAMIGMNDVVENVFSLDDARTVAAAVRKQGMAGLHFWSLDRDKPCPAPMTAADGNCNGLPGAGPAAFTRAVSAPAEAGGVR
ncbi:MAG TPA: glycosyl hydrolase [Pseudoduganella sp.]